MHYLGQTHTVAVPLPVEADARGVERSRGAHGVRGGLFGLVQPPAAGARGAHRVAARRGDRTAAGIRFLGVRAGRLRVARPGAGRGSRQVWFDGGWRDTSVWSRLALPAGAVIEGPAILEQPDATTVIEPGHAGRVDALGNLIVEPA